MTRTAENAARDAQLVARIVAGDESALATVISFYAQPLRDFAYLTVRDADLASDVIQEVFVSLWRRRESLSIPGPLADYLYRAVRNRAITVSKHEAAQSRLRHSVGGQFVIDTSAVSESADAELATSDFAAAVESALQSLTPRVREAFLLRQVYDMSYAEIAAALEITVATVHSQVSRAARQIADYLKPFR